MKCKHGESPFTCPFCEIEADRRRESLAKARATAAAKRASGEPPARLDPVEKARKNPTPRNCIAAKCWQCQGGDADPRPKERIRDCQIDYCGIWPLRPYTRTKGPADYYAGSLDSDYSEDQNEEAEP